MVNPWTHWKAPKSRKQRLTLKKRCANKCFLDNKNLKFPICSPTTRTCKINNKGVWAAYVRSKQMASIKNKSKSKNKKTYYNRIAAKARKLLHLQN